MVGPMLKKPERKVSEPYKISSAYERCMKQATFSHSIKKELTKDLSEAENLLRELYGKKHNDIKTLYKDAYGIRLLPVYVDAETSPTFLDSALGKLDEQMHCVGCHYNIGSGIVTHDKFKAMQDFIYSNIDIMPTWQIAIFAHYFFEQNVRRMNLFQKKQIPVWTKRSIYRHITECVYNRQLEAYKNLRQSQKILDTIVNSNLVFVDSMEISKGNPTPPHIVRPDSHRMYVSQMKLHVELERRYYELKQNTLHEPLFPNKAIIQQIEQGEKISSNIYKIREESLKTQ